LFNIPSHYQICDHFCTCSFNMLITFHNMTSVVAVDYTICIQIFKARNFHRLIIFKIFGVLCLRISNFLLRFSIRKHTDSPDNRYFQGWKFRWQPSNHEIHKNYILKNFMCMVSAMQISEFLIMLQISGISPDNRKNYVKHCTDFLWQIHLFSPGSYRIWTKKNAVYPQLLL